MKLLTKYILSRYLSKIYKVFYDDNSPIIEKIFLLLSPFWYKSDGVNRQIIFGLSLTRK
jgi:hypothetical protein